MEDPRDTMEDPKDDEFLVHSEKEQVIRFFDNYIYTKRTMACVALVFLICFIISLTTSSPPQSQVQINVSQINVGHFDELTVREKSRVTTISCSKTCGPANETTTHAPATERSTYHREKTKRYELKYKGLTWFGALEHCFKEGKVLASVESREENEQLVHLLDRHPLMKGQPYVWIGLSDLAEENTFTWIATGQEAFWTNWAMLPQQPDNWHGNEHCVELWNQGFQRWRWNDRDCDNLLPFVCEYYE